MAPSPEILAVVFDFDDTLTPDSTTRLLESFGYDTDAFWKEQVRALVAQGYDPTLAWLNLLLADIRSGGRLAGLTNQKLREFGATLDDNYFPGIPEIVPRLRAEVAKYRDISLEFYVISSGLREVILGSEIARSHFTEVYACELGEDESEGLRDIKRCVTFTEKTRYRRGPLGGRLRQPRQPPDVKRSARSIIVLAS